MNLSKSVSDSRLDNKKKKTERICGCGQSKSNNGNNHKKKNKHAQFVLVAITPGISVLSILVWKTMEEI